MSDEKGKFHIRFCSNALIKLQGKMGVMYYYQFIDEMLKFIVMQVGILSK